MGVRLTFGEWLDDQLRRKGWTQAAFADLVGAARTTVNTWVNDVTPPRRRAARDIARALGVEVDEVLVRAGYPPQTVGYVLPEERDAAAEPERPVSERGLWLWGRWDRLPEADQQLVEALIERLTRERGEE